MFTMVHDLTLHYQVDGRLQGPPLIFINSLGCNLHLWDAVLPVFTGRFRVIRYDKRGHGLSDAPSGPSALRDLSEDLSALLVDLQIKKPVLIGISVGGLIAMDYALKYPAGVSALVLCDTAPRIGSSTLWDDRIQAVQERGLEGMAETIISRWFLPSFKRKQAAEYRGCRNMLVRTPLEGYTGTCAALRDADLSPAVKTIVIPTLAICGAEDAVVSPEQTREWAACLPNARVEIIDGAAHLPCIEQPEVMAMTIEKFLREDCHV